MSSDWCTTVFRANQNIKCAGVAESVDAADLKSVSLWEWGFKSPRPHHFSYNDYKTHKKANYLIGLFAVLVLIYALFNIHENTVAVLLVWRQGAGLGYAGVFLE